MELVRATSEIDSYRLRSINCTTSITLAVISYSPPVNSKPCELNLGICTSLGERGISMLSYSTGHFGVKLRLNCRT